MSRTKRALIALVAAAIAEGIVLAIGALFGGGENSIECICTFLHVPGMILVDLLNCTDGVESVIIFVTTGLLQFFLIFWFIGMLWNRLRNRPTKP